MRCSYLCWMSYNLDDKMLAKDGFHLAVHVGAVCAGVVGHCSVDVSAADALVQLCGPDELVAV